jgi:uncharacterized protein
VAERDLGVLLKSAAPKLNPDTYCFVTLPPEAAWERKMPAIMRFNEAEGTTLIMRQAVAESADLPYIYPCAWITLAVNSDLAAVGFLAEVTRRLATAGISCNPVSAFHHDHLFVPVEKAAETMEILRQLAQ